MEIIEGIWAQSGVNAFFIIATLLFGIFGIAYVKKRDLRNYLFLSFFFIVFLLKLSVGDVNSAQGYMNITLLISFPVVLMALPFYRKAFSHEKVCLSYILILILFFCLDLPFIRLFSTILLPNYQSQIIFIAGMSNLLSLSLLNSESSRFKRLGKILFFVTYIPTLMSLTKWMMPIILGSPLLYFYIVANSEIYRKFSWRKFLLYVTVSLGVLFLLSDRLAINLGYESMSNYLDVRLFKRNVFEATSIEQNQILGIADGNRFNLYSTILTDYLNYNIFLGLDINYINRYKIPAHNFVVYYLSMLGVFSAMYIYVLLRALISFALNWKMKKSRLIMSFFVIAVIFNFMVGESYGNIILLTFIFINLTLANSNVLRSDSI